MNSLKHETNFMPNIFAGIEVMANRFSVIQTQIKKKPYDFLDQRKQEFTQDFEDFQRQIKELNVSISVFI